jgi:hypothetical protein
MFIGRLSTGVRFIESPWIEVFPIILVLICMVVGPCARTRAKDRSFNYWVVANAIYFESDYFLNELPEWHYKLSYQYVLMFANDHLCYGNWIRGSGCIGLSAYDSFVIECFVFHFDRDKSVALSKAIPKKHLDIIMGDN